MKKVTKVFYITISLVIIAMLIVALMPVAVFFGKNLAMVFVC